MANTLHSIVNRNKKIIIWLISNLNYKINLANNVDQKIVIFQTTKVLDNKMFQTT